MSDERRYFCRTCDEYCLGAINYGLDQLEDAYLNRYAIAEIRKNSTWMTVDIAGDFQSESLQFLIAHIHHDLCIVDEMNRITELARHGDCPINSWFELSYAQYLTVPRSVLQAMRMDWKMRFADLLQELDDTIDWRPKSGRYWCRLKNSEGKFVEDKFMEYRNPTWKLEDYKK